MSESKHADSPSFPMQDVQGKVAFITGGSSGIGLGIAQAFAQAGMKIVIGYRTASHLDETLESLKSARDRVHAIRVDVTDRAALERAADETLNVFGKVHVLVNNAGVTLPATLGQTTYDDWDFVMDVNLNGAFNGVRTFLPRIQAHGEGGYIITTSSILGLFVAGGGREAAYSVSKFAVVGLTEALRAELTGTNIGVSVFCPGLVTSNVADSSRNRPSRLADVGFRKDPQSLAREKAMRRDPQLAMDPREAGEILLRGMRNNDLYILTHPEFAPLMQDRHDALIASIPQNLQPTEKRSAVARSMRAQAIYATELTRQKAVIREKS